MQRIAACQGPEQDASSMLAAMDLRRSGHHILYWDDLMMYQNNTESN